MAFGLYVLVGLMISLFFISVPKRESVSLWMFFFLIIGWFPLYLLGIVLVTIQGPQSKIIDVARPQ